MVSTIFKISDIPFLVGLLGVIPLMVQPAVAKGHSEHLYTTRAPPPSAALGASETYNTGGTHPWRPAHRRSVPPSEHDPLVVAI